MVSSKRLIREAKKRGLPTKILEDLENELRRKPKEPAPIGGITLNKAAKSYDIPIATLYGWYKLGYISFIKKIGNKVYINEEDVKNLKVNYEPGRGKWSFMLKMKGIHVEN